MGVFQSAEELYAAIGGLFDKGAAHPEMGPKVGAGKVVIRFEYSDPDSALTIDSRSEQEPGRYFRVYRGDTPVKPDVVMTMKADVAHQFWLGNVNITVALARGQMKVRGPLQQIMKLIPVIKPAFDIYKAHLDELGLSHLKG
jgi:hypothetical protein